MSQKFVLISSQRSGSSYLMRALDDHPEVLCAGTIFKKSKSERDMYPELSFNYADKKKSKLFKYFKRHYISSHLKKVFSHGSTQVNGFRLMANHAEDLPGVLKECRNMNAKAIVLIRKNIVRQSISLTVAQNAGLWIKPENDAEGISKIEMDIQRLGKNIAYFQRCRTKLEHVKFPTNPLVIYFEDLAGENRATVVKRVYKYLGVLPDYKPKVSELKKSKYNLKQRISNHDEVVAFVSKKGLEALITDE